MTGGPERKYTDRDVRENPDMQLAVIQYLEQYEGEFEFLIDMKMRIASDYDLTVGMVRGVLNCMRHDPRVTNLPEPMPEYEGKVLQMPKRSEPDDYVPYKKLKYCENEDFHPRHGGQTYRNADNYDGYRSCEGKYFLNREDVEVRAVVKVPWVTGKSGQLIHKVDPDNVWYMWRALAHEWGWFMEDYYGYPKPDLYVRPQCLSPRLLKNPILFGYPERDEVLDTPYSGAKLRRPCPRCFPDAMAGLDQV
jgi:hypothetical protein